MSVLNPSSFRSVGKRALAASAVNFLAALLMATVLKPALPTGSYPERFYYLAGERPLLWLGWGTWMAAAGTLLLFFDGLSSRLEGEPLSRAVRGLALAGMVPDLLAETLAAGLLPDLAARYLEAPPEAKLFLAQSFATWDRVMVLLTGFLGNGLYTLAGILLSFLLLRTGELPSSLILLGAPAWAAGLFLSGATLLGSVPGMFLSTALLMPFFCLWTLAVGLHYLCRGSAPAAGA